MVTDLTRPGRLSVAARLLPASGAILCYHGITRPGVAAGNVANMSLAHLLETIHAVQEVCAIVPLPELVARHTAGRSTKGLAALTFDDAYETLLTIAAPFLRSLGVPYTTFAVSCASAKGAPYWWDRIDTLHAVTPYRRWRELERELGLPEEYRLGQPRALGPLRPLRQWILTAFRGRDTPRLDDALAALEAEQGVVTMLRAMTFPELETLARDPLVTIGVHTRSHAVLPLLDDDAIREEIAVGHAELCEQLRSVLPVLAIPYGLYDGRVVRIAREAGMHTSLTLAGHTLRRTGGASHLPRFSISRNHTPWSIRLAVTGVRERVAAIRDRPPWGDPPPLPSPVS